MEVPYTALRLVSIKSCIITLTLIPDGETNEHVLDSEKKNFKKMDLHVISLTKVTLA